jgi:hypothetical protein
MQPVRLQQGGHPKRRAKPAENSQFIIHKLLFFQYQINYDVLKKNAKQWKNYTINNKLLTMADKYRHGHLFRRKFHGKKIFKKLQSYLL